MTYTEKMNRLKEFLPFFEKYLSEPAADSILYVSLRRNTTWKNVIILVGINDLDYQYEIATYASRIIIDIQEYIPANGMHTYEQQCTIKRVNCFEFDLEKKAKKEAAIKDWLENPYNYFERSEEGTDDHISNEYMIWQGLKINLWVPKRGGRGYVNRNNNIILGSMYLGLYDFKVTDRHGREFSYLKLNNKLYIKYRTGDAPSLITTNSIGVAKFDEFGPNNCRYKETTKTTYDKWAAIVLENSEPNY